ncbi:hypothetical protein [Streptomyces sp. NPDC007346]|uniref:hypothetical protein n=1 Tax=Streptomyces sp. NPDC007346 TaxID=3154682 RepID=UPI0034552B0C
MNDVLHRLAAHGVGARRQRAAYARRRSLLDVDEHVADHTARAAPADAVTTPAT